MTFRKDLRDLERTCVRFRKEEMATNNTYVDIGNSFVRYLELPEIDTFSYPGSKLFHMRQYLDQPGIKLLVSGIPDIV